MEYDFQIPTQVRFTNPEAEETLMGIAYHKEIICACCGGVFEVEEVENIIPLPWVDFSDYVL